MRMHYSRRMDAETRLNTLAAELAAEALARGVDLEAHVRASTSILTKARQDQILAAAQAMPTRTW